jgi:hypothetical protein
MEVVMVRLAERSPPPESGATVEIVRVDGTPVAISSTHTPVFSSLSQKREWVLVLSQMSPA